MSTSFSKMHGLGNDFVVIELITQSLSITPALVKKLSDRHRGIGFDQLLLLTKTNHAQADFGYRIFNADGSVAQQCGNGARCIGLFVQQKKLSAKKNIVLETVNGLVQVAQNAKGVFSAEIAIPDFNPKSLPFITTEKKAPYHLSLPKHELVFDVVSVGNPHCIIEDRDFSVEEKIFIGQSLNAHPAFPEKINVGFMKIDSRNCIHLTVYERGVGLTAACGSGACAAVAVGQSQNKLDSTVEVHQHGGILTVIWPSPTSPIQLLGEAALVFDGCFYTHYT